MRYTQFDLDILDSIVFSIPVGINEVDIGGPNKPEVVSNQQFENVKFQFPPKIFNDTRKADWKEEQTPGPEPIAAWNTVSSREFTLVWRYVVDGGTWDTETVAKQVKLVRGYFARIRSAGDGSAERAFVAYLRLWLFGGDVISVRLKSLDVKHGETLVSPLDDSLRILVYPLVTDISASLAIWTMGRNEQGSFVQSVPGLSPNQPPEWY